MDYYNPDVVTANDYYCFGMQMPGRTYSTTMLYRFGFTRHEKMDEIYGPGNAYDMGARILETRLGRTGSIDPKAALYPSISPYAYALNTPINAIDPDGKLVIFINGQHTGTWGKNYWGGFDEKVMRRIGDNKSRYYDGALGGFKNTLSPIWSNQPVYNTNLFPPKRYSEGYDQGKNDAADIIAKLQKDEKGNITESVKIISHSLGGAYAKGFAQALSDYVTTINGKVYDKEVMGEDAGGNKYYYKKITGFKIEFEVDFASFQPNMQKTVEGVRTIQISHLNDAVVNDKLRIAGSTEQKIDGVNDADYHLDTKDKKKGHSIFTFTDEINKYVPPSNNNPTSEKMNK